MNVELWSRRGSQYSTADGYGFDSLMAKEPMLPWTVKQFYIVSTLPKIILIFCIKTELNFRHIEKSTVHISN